MADTQPAIFIRRGLAILLAALALTSCAGDDKQLPESVLLYYDFSGDWAATAGNECSRRLDLSDSAFLSIAAERRDGTERFYLSNFFMLVAGERSEALLGEARPDGALYLSVETETVLDGRPAAVTYTMFLDPETNRNLRLVELHMTALDLEDGRKGTVRLLSEGDADPSVPALAAAGSRGLCLVRMPR